jgi:hypothetical protein
VPFVNPAITQLVVTDVHVAPPGVAVAVYPVMTDPPSLLGALQVTVSVPSPSVSVGAATAPGAPIGVTAAEAAEEGPVPATFVAVTVTV